ncbi:hypothetical protein DFJ74DRAFT_690223 [Hyaloraphidium curvatum]|nr:hypothetical protein DFJ74DRAFT_690223 [Hyaloraphidium curvatum]
MRTARKWSEVWAKLADGSPLLDDIELDLRSMSPHDDAAAFASHHHPSLSAVRVVTVAAPRHVARLAAVLGPVGFAPLKVSATSQPDASKLSFKLELHDAWPEICGIRSLEHFEASFFALRTLIRGLPPALKRLDVGVLDFDRTVEFGRDEPSRHFAWC